MADYVIAASGGNYTSLSGFVTGEAVNLTTFGDFKRALFRGSSFQLIDRTSFAGFSGSTSSLNVRLQAEAGSQHTGKVDTGVCLASDSGVADAILRPPSNLHVSVSGLRFKMLTGAVHAFINNADGGIFDFIENCFFDCNGVNTVTERYVRANGNIVRNCFICKGVGQIGIYVGASGSILHCTAWSFVGDGGGGILCGGSGTTIRNCLVLALTGGGSCINTNGGSNPTYCIIGDTSATGTGVIQSATVSANNNQASGTWVFFTNLTSGTEDLNLVTNAGVSINRAENAGTADYATDFAGNTRGNPPDIGAAEIVSAAVGQPTTKRLGGFPFIAGGRKGVWRERASGLLVPAWPKPKYARAA